MDKLKWLMDAWYRIDCDYKCIRSNGKASIYEVWKVKRDGHGNIYHDDIWYYVLWNRSTEYYGPVDYYRATDKYREVSYVQNVRKSMGYRAAVTGSEKEFTYCPTWRR